MRQIGDAPRPHPCRQPTQRRTVDLDGAGGRALESGEMAKAGMQSMDGCIRKYVQEGLITPQEGLRVANDPEHMKPILESIPQDE